MSERIHIPIQVRISSGNPLICDSNQWRCAPLNTIMVSDMTVLFGVATDDDVVLATDYATCTTEGDRVNTTALKLCRTSSTCCIGTNGASLYGDQVLAWLYGVEEWLPRGKGLQDCNLQRLLKDRQCRSLWDTIPEEILDRLSVHCIKSWEYVSKQANAVPFRLGFLIGGQFHDGPGLYVLAKDWNWRPHQCVPGQPTINTPDESDQLLAEASRLISTSSGAARERLAPLFRLYHDAFPAQCTAHFATARLQMGFEIDEPSKAFVSNSREPDP